MPIHTAKLRWTRDVNGAPLPVSDAFDDVYFSRADGFLESRYVFVEQNQLPQRFNALFARAEKMPDAPAGRFVIAETGFGTGLNFLSTCLAWQTVAQQYPKARPTLHFISTEKFPLAHCDLQQVLHARRAQHPELGALIDALIDAYPLPIAGCQRRHFMLAGTQVVLDLWLGDATESFQTLANQHPHTTNAQRLAVDAWFLDGFAPRKNSALWSDALFDAIAALAKDGTTLATFSAAGGVRRALIRIGATPTKIKGYGHKREMLSARFHRPAESTQAQTHRQVQSAIVIGAGVSGLSIAHALAKRGLNITIIDKHAPLAGASGNPRALLCPKLSLINGAAHHLSTQSFLYATHFYQHLSADGRVDTEPNRQTAPIFEPVGVIDCLLPTQKSADKLHALVSTYPERLIHPIAPWTHTQFSALVAGAGLINPAALASAVLAHPNINFRSFNVQRFSENTDGVQLHGAHDVIQADIAIVAAGWKSASLHEAIFDCRKIRGQVSWLDNPSLAADFLDATKGRAIKYDGYACAFEARLLFGASFVRNDTANALRHDEHLFNFDKFAQAFPKLASAIKPAQLQGRASIRAQTPDYHPIVGKVTDKLYVISGMGSKGFAFAPLCAEILAGLINAEFMPASDVLLKRICPKRDRLAVPLSQD